MSISGIQVDPAVKALGVPLSASKGGTVDSAGCFAAMLQAARAAPAIPSGQDASQPVSQSSSTNLSLRAARDQMINDFSLDDIPWPADFPHDFKQKLESAWSNCKTTSEKLAFENMLGGTVTPSFSIPTSSGEKFDAWAHNWQQLLAAHIRIQEGLAGSIPAEYRADYIKATNLARTLLL